MGVKEVHLKYGDLAFSTLFMMGMYYRYNVAVKCATITPGEIFDEFQLLMLYT